MRRLLVLACGLLLGIPSAQAIPMVPDFSNGPVVFDFEDGLQGWTLGGSAQRVNTQVLGRQWAVFGDGLVGTTFGGGAGISLEVDLTNVTAMQLDYFFAGNPSASVGIPGLLWITLLELDPEPFPGPCPCPSALTFLGSVSPDPTENPASQSFALNRTPEHSFEGVHVVTIGWGLEAHDADSFFPPPSPDSKLGFIDNITLVPIPEPATLALVGLGIAGLAVGRRRLLVLSLALGSALGAGRDTRADLALETVPRFPNEDQSVSLRVCGDLFFPTSGFDVTTSVTADESGFSMVVEVFPPEPDEIVLPAFFDLDVSEEVGFLESRRYDFKVSLFEEGNLREIQSTHFFVGSPGDVTDGAFDTDVDFVQDRDDNCPTVPNLDRRDADQDGIGDACECGDFNGDGFVNTIDARLAQRCATGEIPCEGLCDANEDGICNSRDARLVQRLAVGELGKDALYCAERGALDREIRDTPRCPRQHDSPRTVPPSLGDTP